MRDGLTRKLEVGERDHLFAGWMAQWRATVVVLSGEAAGSEYGVDRPAIVLGRAPDSGWGFDDDTMSREHATLEYVDGAIRLRDLGSMNGTRVNGGEVMATELKNGDRFQLGNHEFQFVLEKRPRQPKTYVVSDE